MQIVECVRVCVCVCVCVIACVCRRVSVTVEGNFVHFSRIEMFQAVFTLMTRGHHFDVGVKI